MYAGVLYSLGSWFCTYIILEAAFQEGRVQGADGGWRRRRRRRCWSSCKYGHRSSLVVLHCTLHGIYLFSCVESACVGVDGDVFSRHWNFTSIRNTVLTKRQALRKTVVLLVEHPLFPALARTVRGGCA